jgi:hypothetical protein
MELTKKEIRDGIRMRKIEDNLNLSFAFMTMLEKIGDNHHWNDEILIKYITESYYLAKEIRLGENHV